MIALGWTTQAASGPDVHPVCSGIALVGGTLGRDATAKDLVRAQMACADRIDPFLPAAPLHATDLETARAWSSNAPAPLIERLNRLSGKVQITLDLRWDPIPTAPGEGSWLRRRAARLAEQRQRADETRQLVSSAVREVCAADPEFEGGLCWLRAHLLLPRIGLSGHLGLVVAALPENLRSAAQLSGPWPCYAFAGIEGTDG